MILNDLHNRSDGLDWNPIGKPKPGAEDEFAALFKQLGELPTRPGWLERIGLQRRGIDRDAIKKRWEETQFSPHETLGAPRVGRALKRMRGHLLCSVICKA
jgi:hypothetical protein